MNIQVGKSAGIALLMAAALLAALFAMGVFAPAGVDANVKSNPAPTAMLDKTEPGDEDVTLTVTFQVNDAIDGAPTAGQADDNVTIALATTIADIPTTYDVSKITVTQDGAPVGKVVDPIATAGSIVITVADAGDTPVAANETVTVTIPDLTLAGTAAAPADAVSISQTGQAAAQTVSLAIYDPEDALSDVSASVTPRTAGATGVIMTLKFTPADGTTLVTVTLPTEYQAHNGTNALVEALPATDVTIADGDDGDTITIAAASLADDTEFEVKLGPNSLDADEDSPVDNATAVGFTNPDEAGTFTVSFVQGAIIPAMTDTFTTVEPMPVVLSSKSPGKAVRVEISTNAEEEIPGGDDIRVTLEDFGIPDTIDESDVIIRTATRNINPSDVSVSGDTVTLSLPTTVGQSETAYMIPEGMYTIIFKQGAGLMNPTSGGAKDITVSDLDDEDDVNMVTIDKSVSVKPSFVTRGDDAVVTAKGLRDGTTTVHLGSLTGAVLGSGTADDGVVEIVIDTSDLERGAMRSGDIDKGENTLYVKDANDDEVGTTTIGVKPTIKLGSDSVKRSGKLEIMLSDWYYGATADVTIGGVSAAEDLTVDGHKDTLEVTVPATVRFGKQEVKVSGSNPEDLKTSSVTAEVTVDALSINISPSTVVPGAQITITGSGYVAGEEVQTIMIGDKEATRPTSSDDRKATSAGRIAYTVTVPLDVGKGDKDVEVTVGTGADERVGVGEITVPAPSIELDPAESVPGSIISVNGSGFASNGRLEVRYKGEIEEVGLADSSGSFHIRLEIPSDAGVGAPGNEVKVEVRGTPSINATAKHKTPGPAIMVPEQAQVGTLVTITGSNFEPFSALDVRIGGRDATPASGAETDKNGDFDIEVRVPRLAAGSHSVTVMDAEDNSVTETFSVVTTAIVSTPEEVFGVLGDKLVSVWSLDNATKKWSAYFPGAPEGVSDLTGVSRGDIVWINVNADVEFQGGMLTTGWNLISLE